MVILSRSNVNGYSLWLGCDVWNNGGHGSHIVQLYPAQPTDNSAEFHLSIYTFIAPASVLFYCWYPLSSHKIERCIERGMVNTIQHEYVQNSDHICTFAYAQVYGQATGQRRTQVGCYRAAAVSCGKHIVWYVTHNMSRAMSHVHVLHNCIAVTGWAGVHWCWVTGGDRGRGCTAVRPDTGPPPTSYFSIISHLNILHLNLVLPGAKHCHHWHTFKTDIKTAGGKWLYHLDGQRTG